jgi:hypothetical protein
MGSRKNGRNPMGYEYEMSDHSESNGNGDAPGSELGLESLGLTSEALAILTEMTENLRDGLPEELRFQFHPGSPRTVLENEDSRRVADGYLPTAWYERAAAASGPPSWQVAAMETPAPGLRWPGGKPADPLECARVYEMHIDWLTEIALRSDPIPDVRPEDCD